MPCFTLLTELQRFRKHMEKKSGYMKIFIYEGWLRHAELVKLINLSKFEIISEWKIQPQFVTSC